MRDLSISFIDSLNLPADRKAQFQKSLGLLQTLFTENFSNWEAEDVVDWLDMVGFPELKDIFEELGIDGKMLKDGFDLEFLEGLGLSEERLQEFKDRLKILQENTVIVPPGSRRQRLKYRWFCKNVTRMAANEQNYIFRHKDDIKSSFLTQK